MQPGTPPGGNLTTPLVASPWDATPGVARAAHQTQNERPTGKWSRFQIDTTDIGKRFGDYEIIDTIQRGGMGEVVLAERLEADGRRVPVVLKRLLADLLEDERYVSMFLVEARVMSQLVHPNIVKVLDVPVIDGKQCLAMEYVHGRNVLQILRRCHKLGTQMPPQVALHLTCEVLKGLEYAHSFVLEDGRPLELVHRDVTPGNMLVSFDGDVKITDFGIAKSKMSSLSTTVGIVKGTTRYLSPEQIRGEPATLRSDLFSCASVMVEMLTGVPLFDRGTVPPTLFAIASGQRPTIGKLLPFHAPGLAAVIEQTLSIDPSARPRSAREFRLALEAAAHEVGRPIDRLGLSLFLKELFPESQGPMAAFEGAERSGSGLDTLDLTYLLEIRDPIQWGAEKGHLPIAESPELARAREALQAMVTGARPLDASEFIARAPRPLPEVTAAAAGAGVEASTPLEPAMAFKSGEGGGPTPAADMSSSSSGGTYEGLISRRGSPPPPPPVSEPAIVSPMAQPGPRKIVEIRGEVVTVELNALSSASAEPEAEATVRDDLAGLRSRSELSAEFRPEVLPRASSELDVWASGLGDTRPPSSTDDAPIPVVPSPPAPLPRLSSPPITPIPGPSISHGQLSVGPVTSLSTSSPLVSVATDADAVRARRPRSNLGKMGLFVAGALCGVLTMKLVPGPGVGATGLTGARVPEGSHAATPEPPAAAAPVPAEAPPATAEAAGTVHQVDPTIALAPPDADEDEDGVPDVDLPAPSEAREAPHRGEPEATHPRGPKLSADEGAIDIRRPRGARILIDGSPVSKRAPITDLKLPSGQHRVTIIKGAQKKTVMFQLEPGSRVDVSRLAARQPDPMR